VSFAAGWAAAACLSGAAITAVVAAVAVPCVRRVRRARRRRGRDRCDALRTARSLGSWGSDSRWDTGRGSHSSTCWLNLSTSQ